MIYKNFGDKKNELIKKYSLKFLYVRKKFILGHICERLIKKMVPTLTSGYHQYNIKTLCTTPLSRKQIS